MRWCRHISELSILLILALEINCASPSPPLPPSLNLPKPITDLRAVRKGDRVYLLWTIPTRNTDQTIAKRIGITKVCRAFGPLHDCTAPVGEIQPISPAADGKKSGVQTPQAQSSFVDQVPDNLLRQHATQQISYAVLVTNRDKHYGPLSNSAQVPASPTIAAPRNLTAQVNADGVALTWDFAAAALSAPSLSYKYRVFRRSKGSKQRSPIGEVALDSSGKGYIDRNIEWERAYEYAVSSVTIVPTDGAKDVEVEGDDTSWLTVTPHDIFPPSVPAGLQAVQSGAGQKSFVDLTWTPVGEADLAGYNVYRQGDERALRRLNDLPVKTPAYRDSNAKAGEKYNYSVSSIDIRGNESRRSAEAEESLP